MQLEAVITDRMSVPKARLETFQSLEVVDPISDAMTAKLSLSTDAWGADQIRPGDRMLKITYGNWLVFWGVIMVPSVDFAAGRIEVSAHCAAALKAKRSFFRYGDLGVKLGYTADGGGMQILLMSAHKVDADPGPPTPWTYGIDTSVTSAQASRAERGTPVWDALQELADSWGAPDFRFRPVDEEHPGENGVPDPGVYAEFDVFKRMGTDRSEDLVFQHNFGKMNAANVVWAPDFDSVQNHWTQVGPGGTRANSDTHTALVHRDVSIAKYGRMEGWEASPTNDDLIRLYSKADKRVDTYMEPPNYFTVTPAIDRLELPRLFDDFFLGDRITAQAKRGHAAFNAVGRIVQTRLSQEGANGATRVSLDCAPHIEGDDPGIVVIGSG